MMKIVIAHRCKSQFTCREMCVAVFCIENEMYSTSEVQYATNKSRLYRLISHEYFLIVPKIIVV